MDRKEFRRDVKRGGSFSDWRKEGKLILVIHTGSKIGKRVRVQLRRIHTNNDGESEIWSIWRFFQGDDDITKQFLAWLKANDAIDADEVVLRISSGGETEEYSKGELLGMDGYDWRKKLLKPRTEYLFCGYDITDKSKDATDNEIFVLPYSAGKKLNKVWDDEIEEHGEEQGDPWQTPYSCKVTFDNSERGTDMYDASAIRREIPEKVLELMEEQEPADVLSYCDVSEEDSTEGTTAELLAAMCIVSCPLFDTDVETETAEPAPAKPKVKTTVKKPAPAKPAAKKPAPPSRPKPPSKPKVKTPAPAETSDGESPVEDCVAGEAYEYDGEILIFVQWDEAKDRGIFLDEDEMKVPVAAGETVKPLTATEEAEPEPEEAEPEPEGTAEAIEAKDCAKGCIYFDSEGRKLTFARFNASKGKAVFKDEDDERVFLDPDAPVSLDVSGISDALAPRTTKEATDQTSPEETEEAPEPEEGEGKEMAQCPACEKLIPESANKCPGCGAEFADEGDEIPFD